MKITQEQFNNAKETFFKKSLSDTQKEIMLSSIYSREIVNKSIISPFFPYLLIIKHKAFAVLLFIVLLVSGTSYASAMSLPGDILYDMKVDILEPAGLIFRLSEESKNEYRISLLEKRVEELSTLKKSGNNYQESQKASSKATNKNIKVLEQSAIFDEKGQNIEVAQKLELYNNLIDEELKIETNIIIDDKEEIDIDTSLEVKEESAVELESEVDESKDILDTQFDIKIEEENKLPLNIENDLDI